jgi:hypothetical protein
LDAVNTCLSAIGVEPVNTVFDNEDIDVQNALNVLSEIDKEVQSRGWEWNTERDFKLLPDTDGFIFLPNQTLSIDHAYRTGGASFGGTCNVTERGDRLYDLDNHTYVFTQGISLDFISRLPFEELPEVARRYIAITAAKTLQGRFPGSSASNQVLSEDVARALVALEQHDDRIADRNVITQNRTIFGALFGRGVRRKNNF